MTLFTQKLKSLFKTSIATIPKISTKSWKYQVPNLGDQADKFHRRSRIPSHSQAFHSGGEKPNNSEAFHSTWKKAKQFLLLKLFTRKLKSLFETPIAIIQRRENLILYQYTFKTIVLTHQTNIFINQTSCIKEQNVFEKTYLELKSLSNVKVVHVLIYFLYFIPWLLLPNGFISWLYCTFHWVAFRETILSPVLLFFLLPSLLLHQNTFEYEGIISSSQISFYTNQTNEPVLWLDRGGIRGH